MTGAGRKRPHAPCRGGGRDGISSHSGPAPASAAQPEHARRISRGAGRPAGSIAVIVAAAVIWVTGLTAADAIASALIALISCRGPGRSSATPWTSSSRPRRAGSTSTQSGVTSCRPKASRMSTTFMRGRHERIPVLSAHVVLKPGAEAPAVLDELCACLAGDFDIEHSTFQLESPDRRRLEEASHA